MFRFISTACRCSHVHVTFIKSTDRPHLHSASFCQTTKNVPVVCWGVLCLYAVQHTIPHYSPFQQSTINNLYLQLTHSCYCHSRSPWYLHIYSDPTDRQFLFLFLYLCVLCGSQNKQPLFPYTTLTDWFV